MAAELVRVGWRIRTTSEEGPGLDVVFDIAGLLGVSLSWFAVSPQEKRTHIDIV